MLGKVNRVVDFAEKICLAGSSCAMLLIMLVTTFDLLARKLIDSSIPSLYELTEGYWMLNPPVGMNAYVLSATPNLPWYMVSGAHRYCGQWTASL